jgi:1-deoxy-D-xylulose-5-phosphate synthase
MMSNIPNLVYLCPTCVEEAIAMMDYAIDQTERPIAIRIPNGVTHRRVEFDKDYSKLNTYKVDKRGSKVALIGLGSYYALAEEAAAELAKQGSNATIVNPRFATGIDREVLEGLRADHQVVVTLENGVIDGGFGEKIARFYSASDMKVLVKGLKKEFYDKVPYGELMERNRLTPKQIVEDVMAALN